jgi:serine/threonine-protein kinase
VSDELWRRARALFERALEVEPAGRAAFVAAEAGGETPLEAAVARLLEADAAGTGPLETPSRRDLAELFADATEEAWLGRMVGPYRIEARLGRGGMGSVFRARRADGRFEKEVAVKVMRSGLLDPESRRRFDRERQILASLEHPAICRLIDGGEQDGVPWIAMELARGEEITAWCHSRRLPTRDRVELLLEVCDAVAHAHRRLVVHRDLKPSHVVVGADGRVRLLDFGIAKLLDDSAPGTVVWQRILTPEYASPEQVAGRSIGTASDVYALGILLYELIAGAPPFPWAGLTPEAILERLEHSVPPPPSEGARAPRAGASPAPDGARAARGDLDRIVRMALRPRAEDRYPSVEALAADLRRWRDGFPVEATGSGAGYRLRCLLRRRPAATAAAAAAIVAVVASAALAKLEQRRAEIERARAEAVTSLLLESFASADPERTRGETVTAREVLDAGARRLLTGGPATTVEVDVARTLGETYARLGLYDDAARLLDVAARSVGSQTRLDARAALLAARARLALDRGETAGAADLAREAMALLRADNEGAGADAVERLLADIEFADGDRPGATRRIADLRERQRRALGDAASETALTTLQLAGFEEQQANVERAAALLAEAKLGIDPEAPRAFDLGMEESNVLWRLGRNAEALARAEATCALARRVWGERHPSVARCLNLLGAIHRELGQVVEAEHAFLAAIELQRELYGPRHPVLARTLYNRATQLQFELGRPGAAEPLYREAVETARAAFDDPHHAALGNYLRGWARGLIAVGRVEEGMARSREAIEIFRRHPNADVDVASAESDLGWGLLECGRNEEAANLLRRALPALEAAYGPDHRIVARARERLARAEGTRAATGAPAPAAAAKP